MRWCAAFFITAFYVPSACPEWPQYRGPGGTGVSESAKPPVEFGPSSALLWKIPVATGHSSPCIQGDRIYITGYNKESSKLFVAAFDRHKGSELWRRAVTPKEIEVVHDVSSPAAGTAVTDGKRIVVYFGSYGLIAYTPEGEAVWEAPMPLAKASFGNPISPVIAGDLVLVSRDYNPEPQLFAFSKIDGKLVWKKDLPKKTGPGANTAHSSPAIWQDQVVLHRPWELAGFSLKDGSQIWSVDLVSGGTSTPLVTEDTIYVAAYGNFGDPDVVPKLPPFTEMAAKHDSNKDGKLSAPELPPDLYFISRPGVPSTITGASMTMAQFLPLLDPNKDGGFDEQEWAKLIELVKTASAKRHGLTAVKPRGTGNITASGIKWIEHRNIPEVPSPLRYRDRVYMIMNGGILTCLDAETGKVLHRGRIGAPGPYYSSPVAADGKIFVASGDGVITVLSDGNSPAVLAQNDLGEPIYATPALAGSVVYVRTQNHLWAFGAARAPVR
jgi:outer membrane protein assembly factor BamB